MALIADLHKYICTYMYRHSCREIEYLACQKKKKKEIEIEYLEFVRTNNAIWARLIVECNHHPASKGTCMHEIYQHHRSSHFTNGN